MQFIKDNKYIMFKISSPLEVDFFESHKKLIEKNGYVWFCRFGKNNMKISSMSECEPIIFIKEAKKNNDGFYIANCIEIKEDIFDNEVFPEYYNELSLKKACWLKITSLEKADMSFVLDKFLSSSGGAITGVLKSMCTAFYMNCKESFEL